MGRGDILEVIAGKEVVEKKERRIGPYQGTKGEDNPEEWKSGDRCECNRQKAEQNARCFKVEKQKS